MAIRSTFTTGEVLTAADLTDTIKGNFINTDTSTARTFGTADAGNLVTFNNNSGGTATIPTNTTWGAAVGTTVGVANIGTAGSFTIGTASGVTLNAASATLAIQESGSLVKMDTNTWWFFKQDTVPGLAFITQSTFSAASSVSVNNCFTSTYDNYRITLTFTAMSADLSVRMRLRASGSDNSTANYDSQLLYQQGSTVAGVQNSASSGNTQWHIGSFESDQPTASHLIVDIVGPQATAYTKLSGTAVHYGTDTNTYNSVLGNLFKATTSFDGLSLLTSTGTMSGTVRVYGYRNS